MMCFSQKFKKLLFFFIKVDDRGFLMLTKEEQEAEHLTVNANG